MDCFEADGAGIVFTGQRVFDGKKRGMGQRSHTGDPQADDIAGGRLPADQAAGGASLHIQLTGKGQNGSLKERKAFVADRQTNGLGITGVDHRLLAGRETKQQLCLRHIGDVIKSVDIFAADGRLSVISFLKVAAHTEITICIVE